MFAPPVAESQVKKNAISLGAPARSAGIMAGNKPGAQPGREATAGISSALASRGEPLDVATRTFMEPRLGRNLGAVRIHRDEAAADSARAQGALAYAVGRDLVFGAGQYAPHTPAGRKLLAHELTHSVQQNLSPSRSLAAPVPDADAAIETEANRSADSLARGHSFRPALRAAPGMACQHHPGIITQDPFAAEIVGEAERGRIDHNEVHYEQSSTGHYSLVESTSTENYAIVRTAREANVVVRIHLVEAAPPNHNYDESSDLDRWRTGITSVWNGRFSLTNGVTTLPIVFDPLFVNSGANAHHRVLVHRPRANQREDEANWFEDSTGLVIAHEFGHMLGDADEYHIPGSIVEIPRRFGLSEREKRESSYEGITGVRRPSRSSDPRQPYQGYDMPNSIMNDDPSADPSTLVPQARHMQNILIFFNRHLRQPHEARFHIRP